MNYKLINQPNSIYSGLEQVLINRGIEPQHISHWLNTTDKDINDYRLLGEDKLKAAMGRIVRAVANNEKTLIIVDCDADGYCSSSLLINYLYDHFPAWVLNCVRWFIHDGKQHGLSDVNVEKTAEKGYSLIITPDASSADYEYHLAFVNKNIDIIVLDHHEAKIVSPNAIVINNQLSAYPNKSLCGAGVTWQFCRYFDSIAGTHYAENYIDLVALGLVSDMMSLRDFETKHLIFKGFEEQNRHNPYIVYMFEKQEYTMAKKSLPNGVAWYITPFVNAMTRSGEPKEQELFFKAFLKFRAFDIVLSDKKGHKLGETEQLVIQAIRASDRVKRRQTEAQDSAMELLEDMIEKQDLMAHKVLLFLLEPGKVERSIAGLAANKIMGKYQRPCAVLTKRESPTLEFKNGEYLKCGTQITYEGSARGCDAVGVSQFKDICENTNIVKYVAGHQGAFGLGLYEEDVNFFLEQTDKALISMPNEPSHFVDYIYEGSNVNGDQLLDITLLQNSYGKDVNESYVAVEKLHITADMVQVFRKKNNTIKVTLPNRVALIFFDALDDFCEHLQNTKGYIEMNVVGIPNRNEYMGWVSPQIIVEDYEITGESRFNF